MSTTENSEQEKSKAKSFIKRLTIYASMISLIFILRSTDINKRNKEFFHITTRISKGKIEYNSGTIYIGKERYLRSIKELKENDILALDSRFATDPNIKIYDSYKIEDPDIREEIIEALLMYEDVYPSKWQRTKNSLVREWSAHNLMHQFGYEHHRTTNVDLNNADEMTYRIRKNSK